MSQAVPSQHPAVVLRSSYQHLRALLALAITVVLALTIAVVVLAMRSDQTVAGANSPVVHRAATRTTVDRLANYPDAPPPNANAQDRLANYPDAPQP